MKYSNVLEEEIKNKVTQDFFSKFDCTKILGKIDFAVKVKRPANAIDFNDEYLLWAEAKQKPTDIIEMLTQLVLTIGKARTFNEIMPPPFLGCYDNEKIAFVPYADIQHIFYQNDFNWNVAPSNRETREFKQVYAQIQKIINNDIPWETYLFNFKTDEKELRRFIRENFVLDKSEITKLKIDKNNFIIIYSKWLDAVKPTIQVSDWELAKKNGIIDGYFYLADLLSHENKTLKDKLYVILQSNQYILDRKINFMGIPELMHIGFSDNQRAHTQFWAKYERPPLEEYWDYIIERQDLLVPQDVRERKGSFFTPKIWVELSQRYLADVLGEDWQDEYYVWDCAAGTGNLLTGLTNKYNIYASTLDKADVDVMHQRIHNGANLLESHVFQFDFLNDDFSKLPQSLQNIINDPEKRKKLVVYINPPYAEASDKKTLRGLEGKSGVEQSNMNKKYASLLGQGNAELFAQFFIRVHQEIYGSILAEFSKLKILQGNHFADFRKTFRAKLEKIFLVPADTFDNVKGKFPIGFFIWNTSIEEPFKEIDADVFDKSGKSLGIKHISTYNDSKYINDWIKPFRANKNDSGVIAKFPFKGSDFQNQNMIAIVSPEMVFQKEAGQFLINANSLIVASIYFAVRKVIPATWLNDRDQFFYPNDGWKTDLEFQNDCLTYTLFNNNIQSKFGVNHWIPFTEYQVGAQEKFDSNFMTDFFDGKTPNIVAEPTLFYGNGAHEGGGNYEPQQREFSETAKNVFKAGKKLWQYYHEQPNANPNASYYDIRWHFKGFKVNKNGKEEMNRNSTDEKFNTLEKALSSALRILARKIEPKVYEYGFLKG